MGYTIGQRKCATHEVNTAMLRAMMAKVFASKELDMYYLFGKRADYPPETYAATLERLARDRRMLEEVKKFESGVVYELVQLDDLRFPDVNDLVLIKVVGAKKRRHSFCGYPLYMAELHNNPEGQFIVPRQGFNPVTLEIIEP